MMTKEKTGSLEMSSINKNNKSTRIEDQIKIKGMKSNFIQFSINLITSHRISEGLTKMVEIEQTKGEADTDL
jgi:hypothetical protein